MDENQKFEEIVNRGLEEFFKRNPRIAIKFGKGEYEKVVESGTKEHIEENFKWYSQWIDELKQLDFENLNFENQISLKAMNYNHNINLFMHEAFPLWKKVPNGLEYFQNTIFLLLLQKGPTTDLAEVILVHIANLPNYLEEFQSRFDGTPIPIIWRDYALEQIHTIPKLLQILRDVYTKSLEGKKSLKNDLLNAFKDVDSIIQNHIEWINSLRVDRSEFAWVLGSEKFDQLLDLRKLPWDRETLMKKGNEFFSSGFRKIKKILKKLYPGKSLSKAIEEFFKEDQIPNFQETLEFARNEAERAKVFIQSHNLVTFPKEKLDVIETPLHLIPVIEGAAYQEPPYFNNEQHGFFMISPTQKEFHSYTLISTWMVHEAFPGHHLDFISNNLYAPLIRLLGFNNYTSMETAEGWAKYSEEMMLNQGFFKNPEKTKQLLSGIQMQEAMMVILDLQLHCKQRSIANACQTLMNIIQINELAAKASILSCTLTPSYPLSYLVGKLLIKDLRQEVEEKMGDKFSLKFFHDIILRCGDLPYFLLKEYFENKIEELLTIPI